MENVFQCIELVLLKRYKLYVSFSIYRSCNFSTGILPNIPFQTESTSSSERITEALARISFLNSQSDRFPFSYSKKKPALWALPTSSSANCIPNALQDLAKRSTDTSINTLPQSNIKFLIIPNTVFGD